MALFPGLPGLAGTRKVKPIWILLKQETVSGSGISWAICKSAPRSRQITMPEPQHSVLYRPDALPAAQPSQSTEGNYCLTVHWHKSLANNACELINQINTWTGNETTTAYCQQKKSLNLIWTNTWHRDFHKFYRVGQNSGARLMAIILSNLNQLKKFHWQILWSVHIWQSYEQECDCLVHFLRLLTVCWPGVQSARE